MVGELKSAVDDLDEEINGREQIEITPSAVAGLNLQQSGTKYVSDGNYTTKYIPATAGEKIYFSAVGSQSGVQTEELRFGFTESIPANNISVTYDDKIVITGSNTETHSYTPAADGYYSVSYWTAKAPTSMLFAIEGDNLLEIVQKHTEQIEELYTKTITDKTLTQENIPADAKTVGDRLNDINEYLYGEPKTATPTVENLNLAENASKYQSNTNYRTHYIQVNAFEEWNFTVTAARAGEFRFGYCSNIPGNNVAATYIDKITLATGATDTHKIIPTEDGYISVSHYHDLLTELTVSGLSGGKNKAINDNAANISRIETVVEPINTDFKLKRTVDNTEIIKLFKAAKHVPSHDGEAFALVHFSDIHGDTGALQRILDDTEYIGDFDDIICTGDMVADESAAIASWWEPTVLTTIGNHESGKRINGAWDYKAVSMAERDALFIAPFEENWGIEHTAGTSYYYKDYTAKNVRMIVVDPQLYLEETAETSAQTAWFTALLSDANTKGLHVIVAVHGPTQGGSCLDCSFNKYGQTSGIADSMSFAPASIVEAVAAEKLLGLNFIGYISGHKHEDFLHKPTADQIEVNITCANPSKGLSNDIGNEGTENPYNIIVVDTRNTMLKIIRGGDANYDNRLRPRKAISFDYSTGNMIAEIN